MKEEKQKKSDRRKWYLKWLATCTLIFVISIFAHECGHGFANALAGIPCSTGFNRVGDIYKYPKQADFREFYSQTEPVLLDFGVPCTIILAVAGTLLFVKSKRAKLRFLGAAAAIDNCLLRFIPCSMVLLTPLLSGKTHIEDEYEKGQLMVQLTGNALWLYVPALISWGITAICLVLIIRTARKRKIDHAAVASVISILAIIIGFVIVFVLDNYIRINWLPLG